MTGWHAGIRTFDASVGGLGGCPYAPGATGNVATEAVVAGLAAEGIVSGVNLVQLAEARTLLDAFMTDDRRTMPPADAKACEACEYTRGEDCCR